MNHSQAVEILDCLLPSIKVIDRAALNYGHEIHDDVRNKQAFISELLLDGLHQVHGLPIFTMNIKLAVHEVEKNIFQVDTNLGRLLSRDERHVHELLKQPFFEITGTYHQLLRMKSVGAAAGLSEVQSRIIQKRIDYLSRLLIEADSRPKFARICDIANTPMLPSNHQINIDKLLDLRQTPEAYSYREWLRSSGKFSDTEVQAITSDWRSRIGDVLETNNAKGIRWLATTGTGTLIGDASGIIASGLDFFLGKFFPAKGPIGFISSDYRAFIRRHK